MSGAMFEDWGMTNREKAKRDIGLARKKINEAEAWLDADSLDLMNAMTALVYEIGRAHV